MPTTKQPSSETPQTQPKAAETHYDVAKTDMREFAGDHIEHVKIVQGVLENGEKFRVSEISVAENNPQKHVVRINVEVGDKKSEIQAYMVPSGAGIAAVDYQEGKNHYKGHKSIMFDHGFSDATAAVTSVIDQQLSKNSLTRDDLQKIFSLTDDLGRAVKTGVTDEKSNAIVNKAQAIKKSEHGR